MPFKETGDSLNGFKLIGFPPVPESQTRGTMLNKKFDDEFIIRLAEQYLYIEERKRLILPLLKMAATYTKEIEDKEFISISLTEEKGDMRIDPDTTFRILQDNYERLPDDL